MLAHDMSLPDRTAVLERQRIRDLNRMKMLEDELSQTAEYLETVMDFLDGFEIELSLTKSKRFSKRQIVRRTKEAMHDA